MNNMNKIIFAVALIVGLSVGVQTFAAQNITPQEAAALNAKLEQMKDALVKLRQLQKEQAPQKPVIASSRSTTLSKEDIAAVNIGLEALKNVLIEMNSALSSGKLSEADKKALSVALSGIVNSVAAINASLKNRSLPALAENLPSQKPIALAKNKPASDELKSSPIFDEELTDELFSEQKAPSGNKQASLIDSLRIKESLWPAIIVSLIVAISAWLGRKKLFELKAKAAQLYSKA